MRTIQRLVSGFAILLSALLPTSCILDTEYDALPFDGKVMPRITGYSGVSQATNDWMYFNLRTGEIFNLNFAGENIKEGEQKERLDWDIAFCGYHLRTNGGTSGKGEGAVADLGYGNYDSWTSVSQLPSGIEWVEDTDKDVYVTMSQKDWNRYLNENGLSLDENPWFDPNYGPQRTLTSANKLFDRAIVVAGPPMTHTPSYHTYLIRTADGERYFKIQIISWYNEKVEIDETGGQFSYYVDELK